MRLKRWGAAGILLLLASCASGTVEPTPFGPRATGGDVLVVGLGGITWEDVRDVPQLARYIRGAAIGSMALRDRNHLGDVYASIGAGNRIETEPRSGWVFHAGEQVDSEPAGVKYGEGSELDARAPIIFPWMEQLLLANEHRLGDGTPGTLGDQLAEAGSCAAAVGNADRSVGEVRTTRHLEDERGHVIVDAGIHREVALGAIKTDGTVAAGSVARSLTVSDPDGPFGVATDTQGLLAEVSRAKRRCDLVFVELGEPSRADAYSTGLADEVRKTYRIDGLRRTTDLLRGLVRQIDLEHTTLVMIGSVSPGGTRNRADLMPIAVQGPGVRPGLLSSSSTRRTGLLWVPDVTALVRDRLGLVHQGHSHVPGTIRASAPLAKLVDASLRATIHDRVRPILALAISALSAIVYLAAALMKGRGPTGRLMTTLLAAGLAFPAASYVTRYGIWRLGPWAIAAGAVILTGLVASIAVTVARGDGRRASMIVLGGTFCGFVIDLVAGTPSQLDSIFGYSAVSAGRFFGLGNLGFAIFAASSLLVAGMLARGGRKALPIAVLAAAVAAVGAPGLGGDVGGTLALGLAAGVLAFELLAGRRFPHRWWPILILSVAALVIVIGLIDLGRPDDSRTHLGAFFAQVSDDPSVLADVLIRKASTAASLAISSRWGLLAPLGLTVIVYLHRRARSWKSILQSEPSLRAAFEALIVAAIAGSLLNDSGVAIAGMMIGIAAPWALMLIHSPVRAADARG